MLRYALIFSPLGLLLYLVIANERSVFIAGFTLCWGKICVRHTPLHGVKVAVDDDNRIKPFNGSCIVPS